MGDVIDIHGGREPRELPLYSVAEAAGYLSIPMSTLRSWVKGQRYTVHGKPRIFKALLKPHRTGLLTFNNFVEAYVLASLTRRFSLPMSRVRQGLDWIGGNRPLLTQLFQTDGVGLFVERSGKLVDAIKGGQVAMREVLEGSLRRVERDGAGQPSRVYPWIVDPEESKIVSIDPRRAFGRPTIADRSLTVEVIADRFKAGDSIHLLAKDYKLSRDQVEVALRWGLHGAAAA
ncbi:MAG TPA: DUF433 domain-containing protein [Kofleriaceae bacterium]|jgi:uncharacterized protein (DUF433 family)